MTRLLNLGIAAGLLVSAASHGYLYVHGYRHLPAIGTGFLLTTSIFAAVAVLIALGGPFWLHVVALAGSLSAVVAFALSRTVGLLGFVEHGWQPAPNAVLSMLAEVLTATPCVLAVRQRGRRA
jgi:hypothetical protein